MRNQFSNRSSALAAACNWGGQRVLSGVRCRVGKAAICFVICLSSSCGLWAQAFQDLHFESPSLVPIPGDDYQRVYFNLAFPGWSGYSGTNQLVGALYDGAFLDSTGIGIMDTNFNGFGGVIQGKYTAFLEAGSSLYPGAGPANAALSQTGLVPLGTKSLSFLAVTYGPGPFAVSLGGTNLTLTSSPVAGQDYSLFQADVSAFAGQTTALEFTLFSAEPSGLSAMALDDIQFSPDAIPEPSTLLLLALGFSLLAFSARRHGHPRTLNTPAFGNGEIRERVNA